MLPPERLLPDVLPTERLLADGRLRPVIRAELRRISNVRNAFTVLGAYVQSFGVVAGAAVIDHPVAWVAAFFLEQPSYIALWRKLASRSSVPSVGTGSGAPAQARPHDRAYAPNRSY